MIHLLKTWPKEFEAIILGTKRHEVRKDDRSFAVGDILRLREWVPFEPESCDWRATERLRGLHTGKTVDVRVTYITKGSFGLPEDLAIMSVEKV